MKWILAAGVAVAFGVIAYAWYRGGEDASSSLGALLW